MDKITFYDLIGFLFPGSLLLAGFIVMNDNSKWYPAIDSNSESFFFQCIFLLLAYIIGFGIHLFADIIYRNRRWNNNLLWNLNWITGAVDQLKEEKRISLIDYLKTKDIDYNSKRFQTKIWTEMYSCVQKTKNNELKTLQAQTTMLANGSAAFFILAVFSAIYILCTFSSDLYFIYLGKYSFLFLLLTIACYFLAVSRQKAIIRSVIWNYSVEIDIRKYNEL